jgi:hypothetical protein
MRATNYPCGRPTRNDGYCKRPVIQEGLPCSWHGGESPQLKVKTRRRNMGREAVRLVQAGGAQSTMDELSVSAGQLADVARPAPSLSNPLEALLALAGEVWRWKELLANKVAQLNEIRYTDGKGAEQLRSEVELFERAMDRCGAFLLQLARLDLEARLVRISEDQAAIIMRALESGLKAAGIEEDRMSDARKRVIMHLRQQSA